MQKSLLLNDQGKTHRCVSLPVETYTRSFISRFPKVSLDCFCSFSHSIWLCFYCRQWAAGARDALWATFFTNWPFSITAHPCLSVCKVGITSCCFSYLGVCLHHKLEPFYLVICRVRLAQDERILDLWFISIIMCMFILMTTTKNWDTYK